MNPERPNPTVLTVDDERVITDTLAMILAPVWIPMFGRI